MPRGTPKNLIPASDPRGHKLTAEELSRGGKNSVKSKKATKKRNEQNKRIVEILIDLLNSKCSENPAIEKTARKLGLDPDNAMIKELLTDILTLNTMKGGTLKDLPMIAQLVGESFTTEQEDDIEDPFVDPLTKSLMEEAERMEAEEMAEEAEDDAD